ncbi:glycosyltransferase [Geovibrio thiophilus]|uniref:Glycosyltransferase n=1 Tax=Geovibrio thiophilus TaxID=139438 RepID=A0A410JUZ6_9BACT|nr:glycosyltransferase family 2 protein [Geovibrio thiophilus]QAR31848.1 glycosyltransferase [Geovibrio thiophilus]
MKLSVVVPLYNEEESIKPFFEKIRSALKYIDYEIILVDDGSRDKTVEMVEKYADERAKLIRFKRNFGQTPALAAGIDYAKGEYIVTIDGDLQNDPDDIPAMIEKLENEGLDVVAGRRLKRQDGFILRKLPSTIANKLICLLTGVYIHDYGCTLKLFKQDIAKNLGLYGEMHRFIPVLAVLQGARIDEMGVRHHPRMYGQSKYGIARTTKVISDLMLVLFLKKYSQRPMHLFGTLGFFGLFFGMLINLYMVVLKLFGQNIWGRPLLLLGVVLTLGGIQLISSGFIAEQVLRTYFESQDKKPYIIKDIKDFVALRPSDVP